MQISKRNSRVIQNGRDKMVSRARTKWLEEGNTNTTYFYRIVNMRYRINTIQSLAGPEGRIIVGDGIKIHIHEYFR